MSNVRNAYLSDLVALFCMFGSSLLWRRQISLYICGVISFTRLSPALLLEEMRHQAGKLQEIGYAEQRTTLTDDDLWIGRHDVGPLPRHRADALLVEAQQEPRPVPVVPLAHADEQPSAQRVERVRHAHKARTCGRRTRSSW